MSVAVGKDVESICGKCGDVWHVVVAKVGEKIVKVQCKQCGGYHRYRAPERGQAASPSPRSRIAGAGSSAAKSSAAKAPKPPPGPSVTVDPNKPSKVYKPHFTFSVGDAIEHATFGRGIVEALPADERIQVWFSGERRVLVHGRASQGAGTKE